uniref:DNA polymerase theta n=1 Tax=Strigamia maritima TaxID=126957 RepID=T1IU43_STRMM
MKYVASSLGNAVMASSMPPDDGLIIFRELDRARKNFVLENELHIIYQVTPIHLADQWEKLSWSEYLNFWYNLPSDQQKVGELVGVEERFLVRMVANLSAANMKTQYYRQLAIHRRFYTALALQDLVNEVPLKTVAKRYGCNRGKLQSLQQSSATFAGMVTSFCNRLGWVNLELLLCHFQSRLNFGIQRELCDLIRLSLLNGHRARLIYNGGFETVADVANADPKQIETLLKNAGPFQSEKQRDNETEYEVKERRKARCIWLMGKEGYTEAEAAKLLVEEARQMLQKDLGINIEWRNNDDESSTNSATSDENQTDEERIQIRDSQVASSISVPENGKNMSTKDLNRTKSQLKISQTPSTSKTSLKNTFETPTTAHMALQHIAIITSSISKTVLQNIAETPSTSKTSEKNAVETPKTAQATLQNVSKTPSTSIMDSQDSPDIIAASDEEENKSTTKYSFRKRIQSNAECSLMGDSLMLTSQLERLLDGKVSPLANTTKPNCEKREILVGETMLISPTSFPPPITTVTSTPCLQPNVNKPNTPPLFGDLTDLSLEAYMGNYKSPLLDSEDLPPTTQNGGDDCFEQSQVILTENEPISNENNSKSLHLEESSTDSCDTIQSSQPIAKKTFTKLMRYSPKPKGKLDEMPLRRFYSDPQPPTSSKISDETLNILNAFTDSDYVPRKRAKQKCDEPKNKVDVPKVMARLNSQSWNNRSSGFGTKLRPNSSKFLTTPHSKRKLTFSKRLLSREENDPEMRISDSEESDVELENVKPQKSNLIADDAFAIIDVAANAHLFQTFIDEWKKQKKFSLCLSCAKLAPKNEMIGAKIKGGVQRVDKSGKGFEIEEKNVSVVGLSVVWEDRDAYFVSFLDNNQNEIESPSLSAPPLDPELSISTRLNEIKKVLDSRKDCTMIAYDLKEQIRLLNRVSDSFPSCRVEDPKVGVWLLDPTDNPKTIHNLVLEFCPEDISVLEHVGGTMNACSIGLTPETRGSPRIRSAVEAVISFRVMNKVEEKLRDENLMKSFKEIEMPSILLLCKMELDGLGFDTEEFRKQMRVIEKKLSVLDGKAHQIAGRRFSLKSTVEVAKVLFGELGLHPNGEKDQNRRTQARGSNWKRSKEYNTNKTTLEKMSRNHQLPKIILEHRKLSSALDNMILPLLRMSRRLPQVQMDRIFGISEHHTATGRVTMHEPNLQTVPRDIILVEAAEKGETSSIVNLRNAFIPFKGGILLAADYSQLELRILAHLSRDEDLISILNSGGDVFKNIAAQWKGKEVKNITDIERQQAKQICYGMIYGIGAKSLSEQLNVEEEDGVVFLHDFKSKYPGMTRYMTKVIDSCRENGYVTTVMGRRRYLPSITSDVPSSRSHAERQAVNTTIQGSAADLAKIAMIRIDGALKKEFGCDKPYRNVKNLPRGVSLVLQLHDELIYEVNDKILPLVAQIVMTEMESALKLSVQLPVKLKSGHSWGSFQEYSIF